jgi:Protein of unknown function (DUF1592)/Protein of unknown function (DUF1588)/Protein of unknown function (DUF1595)/Protein of unknown function (DUF1585)/Protein of unknown function (DUF1587)
MKKVSPGSSSLPALAVCAAVLALGCTSELTGPGGTNATNGSAGGGTTGGNGSGGTTTTPGPVVVDDDGRITNPPAFQAPAGMLRRLTRSQFRNAVRDIFGVEVDVTKLDADIGQFPAIGANAVVTSSRGVEQYETAVEEVVNKVWGDAAKRAQFIGCTPGNAAADACTRTFIETMGRRAWRRPLEAAEVDQLVSVASTATTELGSGVEGVRWATVAMFISPSFLYRPELGVADAAGKLKFTGYETAGRLAFLIWNSLPDQQLLDDAASGALATVDGVKATVNRLLDSANGAGRESIGEFGQQYMELDRVLSQPKDATLYPAYNAALQAGMVRDMRATWEGAAFDDKASALSLFSTPKVTVNAELAKLYGVDEAGLTSTTFKTVALPAGSPRIGILSKAGFLSQFANQKEGSPTLRGKFIREWMMCKVVPPPLEGVALVLPDPDPNNPTTKRQRLDAHRAMPACAGCHALMDPLGLPLENFDGIGAYRATENGLTIDSSGEVNGVPVANARQMGEAMAQNKAMAACMVRRFHAYAMGRDERDVDGTVVNDLITSFETSGYQLRDLVVATVTHDAFSAVAPQP